MKRNEALKLVEQYVSNKNLRKHMIATEACMCRLARYFNEDESNWALCGLLHDLDYDQTYNDPEKHTSITVGILRELGFDEKFCYAVKSHAGHEKPISKMDKALYAVDPLTGLIVAAALMHPDKKLKSLDKDFILRRYKEKKFAAGANREQIASCSELGLSLEDFVGLCLEAMQTVSDELGL